LHSEAPKKGKPESEVLAEISSREPSCRLDAFYRAVGTGQVEVCPELGETSRGLAEPAHKSDEKGLARVLALRIWSTII
jgi:hypothetical protein